jgi:hypothetical protein
MIARTLRAGFIDPTETDEVPQRVKKGTPKTVALRDLRRHGYVIGKEVAYDEERGIVTDVRRTGKIAEGFTPKDGYNLSNADDWTPQQKAKLTRVYNAIKQLTDRPYHVYRGRKKENIQRVQEATAPFAYPKEVKIAFVPVARPGEKPKIKFTKTAVVLEDDTPAVIETVEIIEQNVGRKPIYWADVGVTEEMLRNDVKGAVAKMHAAIGAKEYSPMSGVFQQPESYGPKGLAGEILRIQGEYPERWPKFLLGIQAYHFPQRQDLAAYRRARTKATNAQRKLRKREKDKFRHKTKGRKQRKR